MAKKKPTGLIKQDGMGPSRSEATISLILTLLQWVLPMNPWLKVAVWILIAVLCFDIAWRSPWTINWSKLKKFTACLVVCVATAWGAWRSLDERQLGPNISILGALPVHLWEKVPGPESVMFVNHRLGFIVKLRNNSDAAAIADLAVLEGCVRIEPLAAEGMLIEGEALPRPLVFDKTYAELQQSIVQAIRTSGAIREDSREAEAFSTAYIGVLFSLPAGGSGAIIGVPRSVSIKGDCKAIKNQSSQPSVTQLLEIGPIHKEFPRDLAPQFRDGRLKLRLHVGGEIFELDPRTIGKLHSIRWRN